MIDAAAAEVRIQYRKRMSPEETSARVSIEQTLSALFILTVYRIRHVMLQGNQIHCTNVGILGIPKM